MLSHSLSLLLACGQGGQHLPRTVSLFLPLRVTSQCPYLLLQGMRGVRNPAATRAPPLFDGALEECEQQAGYPLFKQHNLKSAAEQGYTHTRSISLSQAFGVFYLR